MATEEYVLIEDFGILSSEEDGSTLKLVMARWPNYKGKAKEPRYEIRKFNHAGAPGKGIRLSKEEIENIKTILDTIL